MDSSERKILIIDDEPDVLNMVRAVLQTKGYTIIKAEGGQEGIDRAFDSSPDMILCDLMMPRVSGLEVIKQVKADPKLRRVPFVVISALGDDSQRTPDFWIEKLAIDDYIRKPFDPLDLLGRVEYLFRRSSYVSSASARNAESREDVSHDGDTSVPFDVGSATPEEVVTAFIESWNRQDFASEYHCLASNMTGNMSLHDYVARRRQTFMEEKGRNRSQRVKEVVDSEGDDRTGTIVIDRIDTVGGEKTERRETYTLNATSKGWKIVSCKSSRAS